MNRNTEDILVQQTTADYLHDHLGWETINAFHETLGSNGTLGRSNEQEVILTRYLRPKLEALNPYLPSTKTNTTYSATGSKSVSATPKVILKNAASKYLTSPEILTACGASLNFENWTEGIYSYPQFPEPAWLLSINFPADHIPSVYGCWGDNGVQRQAIKELTNFPSEDPIVQNVIRRLYNLKIAMFAKPNLLEEEREISPEVVIHLP